MTSPKVRDGRSQVALVIALIVVLVVGGSALIIFGSQAEGESYGQDLFLQIGSSLLLGAIFVAVGWWFERMLARAAEERELAAGRRIELDDYSSFCDFLNRRNEAPPGVSEEHDLTYEIRENGDVHISGTIRTTVRNGYVLNYRLFKLSERLDRGRAANAFVDVDEPYEGVVLRINPHENAGKWAVFFDPPVANATVVWKREYRYVQYYKADLVEAGTAVETFTRLIPTTLKIRFKFDEALRSGLKVRPPDEEDAQAVGATGQYSWESGEALVPSKEYAFVMTRSLG